MKKIACCIFSYEITKGMKSFGPIGLLKSNAKNDELIIQQINNLYSLSDNIDIFVVVGFGNEKIQKKLPKNIHSIVNTEYENKNHGYALKLALDSYAAKNNEYDGLLLLNNNLIIKDDKNIRNFSTNNSWIISRKKQKKHIDEKTLGCIINSEKKLDYIFYGVGEHEWYEFFYLCDKDINKIRSSIDIFYDNMFLFEIINKSISHSRIEYNQIQVSNNSILHITGIRDKQKLSKLS